MYLNSNDQLVTHNVDDDLLCLTGGSCRFLYMYSIIYMTNRIAAQCDPSYTRLHMYYTHDHAVAGGGVCQMGNRNPRKCQWPRAGFPDFIDFFQGSIAKKLLKRIMRKCTITF